LFYFTLPCFILIFYRICTYKKVISFSTSYGNWSRPWPVQFIWTSWHWHPDAISEHMKSEIHCHEEFNVYFTIQYILQNCIEILQQLLSSSSQVKSQSNCPSHTIDWCMHGPRWHLNSFSAHLESTKIPYKPKSTFVYKTMIPNTIQSRQLETQRIKINFNFNILSLLTSSYWDSSVKVNYFLILFVVIKTPR